MGPLYHLTEEADREAALKEAVDRLRTSGVIFSAFISRFGIFGDLMKGLPHWIEDQERVNSLLDFGKRLDWDRGEGFRGYFAKVSEIVPLHKKFGLQTIVLPEWNQGFRPMMKVTISFRENNVDCGLIYFSRLVGKHQLLALQDICFM